MDETLDKTTLRIQLGAARRARTTEQIEAARAGVRRHVLAEVDATRPGCVAAYEPLRTEPGSTELLTALHQRGIRVLVPLTLPDRDLDWVEWSPTEAGPPLGLAAIAAAELVLVPALAVGVDGMRLGRGGGSYDRALARVSTDARIAALVYYDELRDAVPTESWDLPVGWAVTPSGWRGLGRNTEAAPGD